MISRPIRERRVMARCRPKRPARRDSEIVAHPVQQGARRLTRVHGGEHVGDEPRQVQLRVGIADAYADRRPIRRLTHAGGRHAVLLLRRNLRGGDVGARVGVCGRAGGNEHEQDGERGGVVHVTFSDDARSTSRCRRSFGAAAGCSHAVPRWTVAARAALP
ncbi:hypothetical protein BVI1335_220063 [Burkholderia vietnamiensis]|nr:hypothetical protein BVI1335_220063 [Burkholderia vietnamiensis]